MSQTLRELALEAQGRADDAGRLARAALEMLDEYDRLQGKAATIARLHSLMDEHERVEQAWAVESTRLGTFGQDDEGNNIEVTVAPTLPLSVIRAALREEPA